MSDTQAKVDLGAIGLERRVRAANQRAAAAGQDPHYLTDEVARYKKMRQADEDAGLLVRPNMLDGMKGPLHDIVNRVPNVSHTRGAWKGPMRDKILATSSAPIATFDHRIKNLKHAGATIDAHMSKKAPEGVTLGALYIVLSCDTCATS